jgi:hypothetical protein
MRTCASAYIDLEHDRAFHPLATRCTLRDARTFIFRLGPLVLAPGQACLYKFDWPFGEEEVLAAGNDSIGYEAGFIGVVDQHGVLFGNPPLHIHHSVTFRNPIPEHPLLTHWEPYASAVDSHIPGGIGDRQCRTAEGGARCVFSQLPGGTRLRRFASSTPVVDGIVINEGRECLTNVSIEIAVRLAAQVIEGSQVVRDVVQLTFQLNHPVDQAFGVFMAPRGASVHFKSWRMPLDGRVESHDFHTHGGKSILVEAWIVAASSKVLGLEGLQLADRARPTPLDSLPHGANATGAAVAPIHALQARIQTALLERRRTTRERVLCVITPDEEDGAARSCRDRLLPPACATWRFQAGEFLSVIAFLQRTDSVADSSALLHAAWLPHVSWDDADILSERSKLEVV